MDFMAFIVLVSIMGTFMLNLYYQARNRQMQMDIHLMNAKNFLNSRNHYDNREWFIQRFLEAQTHLVQAQVICSREIDSRTINILWQQMNTIKKGNFISN